MWSGAVWSGVEWSGAVWSGLVRSGPAGCNVVRCGCSDFNKKAGLLFTLTSKNIPVSEKLPVCSSKIRCGMVRCIAMLCVEACVI